MLGKYAAGLGYYSLSIALSIAQGGCGSGGYCRATRAAFDFATHDIRVFAPGTGVAAIGKGLKGGDQMVFAVAD